MKKAIIKIETIFWSVTVQHIMFTDTNLM